MKLSDGSFFKLEKTSIVESVKLFNFSSRPFESVPTRETGPVRVKEFWNNGIKLFGGEKNFYTYNHISNNCQIFLSNLFKANGWLNKSLENFILQDVDKIMKNKGLLNKFAEIATDISGIYKGLTDPDKEPFKEGSEPVSDPVSVKEESVEPFKEG